MRYLRRCFGINIVPCVARGTVQCGLGASVFLLLCLVLDSLFRFFVSGLFTYLLCEFFFPLQIFSPYFLGLNALLLLLLLSPVAYLSAIFRCNRYSRYIATLSGHWLRRPGVVLPICIVPLFSTELQRKKKAFYFLAQK